jgi:iron complex outermembrane receptor protein
MKPCTDKRLAIVINQRGKELIKLQSKLQAGTRITLLLAMLVLAAPAYAQDEAYADEGRMLEEVIITAQKREQTLQEVPVTVSAFSGEFVTENGVQDIRDIAGLTPNVSVALVPRHPVSVLIRPWAFSSMAW